MVRACGTFQEYVRTGRELSPPTDIRAVTLAAITDIDT